MTSQWHLRELTRADQALLWELLYIALWDAPDEERRPRSVLENPVLRRLVENWGRPEDFGLMALDPATAEPAGAIWSRLDRYDQLDDFGCPWPCLGIGLFDKYQGRGAGTALMEGFIEAVKGRVDGLRLGVHPKNLAAQALYRKFGFEEYAIGHGGYPQMRLSLAWQTA